MFSKKILKITALLIIFAAVFSIPFFIILYPAFSDISKKYTADFFIMDTVVSVRSESDITANIKDIFSKYDTALSCDDEKAEAYRLNKNGSLNASDILLTTINNVLKLNKEYGSLTDITVGMLTNLWNITSDNPKVPPENEIKSALETIGTQNISINGTEITLENGAALDFGAVGKGAALDACLKFLKENNCTKTTISTGSSVLLYGNDSFETDVVSPNGGILAAVKTKQCFISTSGGYERFFEADGKTYCHIIDPKTGCPTDTDLTTVTVFCESGIRSDFLSTMIFLDGSKNIEKYLNDPDYKIFAADKEKNLYVSKGVDYELVNKEYKAKQVVN